MALLYPTLFCLPTRMIVVLATVKFSVLLSSSVMSGNSVDSNINYIPKADKFMNPLNAIKTDITSNFTLYDDLNRVVALNRGQIIKFLL